MLYNMIFPDSLLLSFLYMFSGCSFGLFLYNWFRRFNSGQKVINFSVSDFYHSVLFTRQSWWRCGSTPVIVVVLWWSIALCIPFYSFFILITFQFVSSPHYTHIFMPRPAKNSESSLAAVVVLFIFPASRSLEKQLLLLSNLNLVLLSLSVISVTWLWYLRKRRQELS